MTRLLQGFSLLVLLASAGTVLAIDNEFLLNKIQMQLVAEKWVTTKTALVRVSVNATVQTQGIDKVQASVMSHLKKLSQNGSWRLVSLNRNQEKSGLESIQIKAEARLPQSDLSGIRDRAKLISTPGETFTIDTIQFKPSDADIRAAKKSLRNDIYQQAKNEIDELNKIYPDQKYYLHTINFNSSPRPMQVSAMYMKREGSAAAAPPLSVGNKQTLIADVEVGSLADITRKGLPPHL